MLKSIPRKNTKLRPRLQSMPVGSSLTKQASMRECDINTILSQYEKTGLLTHVNEHHGDYADYSDVVDLHTAIGVVHDAESMFSSLPSAIRSEFQNSPVKFLDFVSDPTNEDRMVEMGLLHRSSPSPEDLAKSDLPVDPPADPPSDPPPAT